VYELMQVWWTRSIHTHTHILLQCYPEADVFRIDRVTGELFIAVPLDYERVSEYVLVVAATDQAVPPEQRLVRHRVRMPARSPCAGDARHDTCVHHRRQR
jgi:hypothetical protein